MCRVTRKIRKCKPSRMTLCLDGVRHRRFGTQSHMALCLGNCRIAKGGMSDEWDGNHHSAQTLSGGVFVPTLR